MPRARLSWSDRKARLAGGCERRSYTWRLYLWAHGRAPCAHKYHCSLRRQPVGELECKRIVGCRVDEVVNGISQIEPRCTT